MRITLRTDKYGFYLDAEDGRSIMIQPDYDRIPVAENFGFQSCLTDDNERYDYEKVINEIKKASDFLDEHDGESIEDPGYFDTDG